MSSIHCYNTIPSQGNGFGEHIDSSMWCTSKSCISVWSLVLSADRQLLSRLDADSLLSKHETKFVFSFSYLKHSDENSDI